MWMMSVAADEAASGRVNSRAARVTRWRGESPTSACAASVLSASPRSVFTMCSTITITSSITSPTAAAMPPSVITLIVSPMSDRMSAVTASTTGTATTATTVIFQFRRNRNSTSAASSTPIPTASRTLFSDARMRSDWLYHCAATVPGGSGTFASAASTSRAIWTVLPPGCWYTSTSVAGLPSAVTRV